jgi:CO/xanthine dehydrogenase Mo-binding subunit
MKTENAAVLAPDGRRFSYGDLVSDQLLHAQAAPQSPLKDPDSYRVMNRAIQRVDIPAKVTGGAAYVQDLRLPRMAHGRIVRPPSYGAQLTALDSGSVEKMPGVVKVVRDGNFLAVIADREYQTIEAMRALAAAARWQESGLHRDARECRDDVQPRAKRAAQRACDLGSAAGATAIGEGQFQHAQSRAGDAHLHFEIPAIVSSRMPSASRAFRRIAR